MRKSLMAASVYLCLFSAAIAEAAPKIAAQSVTPMCRVQGNTVFTVSVALNGVTSNFYGATLRYHFVPVAGGAAIVLPAPSSAPNPVQLSVPTGAYNLIISPNQVLTSSASQSPQYPVTVPGNMIVSLGQKKICGPRTLDQRVRARTP